MSVEKYQPLRRRPDNNAGLHANLRRSQESEDALVQAFLDENGVPIHWAAGWPEIMKPVVKGTLVSDEVRPEMKPTNTAVLSPKSK